MPSPTITRNVQNTIVEFGRSCRAETPSAPGTGRPRSASGSGCRGAGSRPRSASSRAPCRASRTACSGTRLARARSPSGPRSRRSSPAGACSVLRPCRSPIERLQRRDQQQHPHRHRRHRADRRVVAPAQQVPRARRADEQRGREIGGDHHVREAVRERRIEDHREPVGRHDAAVDDRVAGRRVHPAVGREDPGRRDQRAERHHHGREEVQARARRAVQPNSITPRKPASRKNAVSTS